jgi:8-oxo-dGTP pyrophosphatase MutT (NUDIX family)
MEQVSRRPLRRHRLEFRALTAGVGALIQSTSTGRYLFLLRHSGSWSDTWGLPGGKLDAGEDVITALNREIREELGGIILDPNFVPVEIFTSDNSRFIYHTYYIAVDEEFIPVLNHEHQGYAWLPLQAAPRPLHPGIVRTLGKKDIVGKLAIAEATAKNKLLHSKNSRSNVPA